MDGGRSDQGQDVPEPGAGISSARWVRIWDSRVLLLWIARRHDADAEDAEDAVQEAMLRAAEHPEVADERLQAWLVAVTMRLCMDGHRRQAKETKRWQRASARAVVQQPGQHLEDEVCERSEAAWVASLAAELLPPRQVQALRLTAAGCDVQQVASQLGVRYRAAESLLARARRTLRTAVIASLGVLAWAWRAPVAAASNPGPIALASASAATMMAAALPPVLPLHERPNELAGPPPAVAPAAPAPAPVGHIVLTRSPAPPRSPAREREPVPPPTPAAVPAPAAPAQAPLVRSGSLMQQQLPELPDVQPLVETAPPPLGRSGSLTQQLPELTDVHAPIDPAALLEVDVPAVL